MNGDASKLDYGGREARGELSEDLLMIRAVGPLPIVWSTPNTMRLARSGTGAEALSQQLSAIQRRRRLRTQQESLQRGATNWEAFPPYRLRPRPPS